MPSGRGPATPVRIGVTGTSGVNIVAVVELRSSRALPGVDWHGLLSLLGRTLPAKMPHLATRETFFICRIISIMINLSLSFCFYFSLGEPRPPPPQGGFLQGAGSVYCASSALKAPLFQKNSLSFSALGNALGGFGGKMGNSWALGGTSGGGGGRLK